MSSEHLRLEGVTRVYPAVELTVTCEPTVHLVERIASNELDLAIITNCDGNRPAETFRREHLLWVTSSRHSTHHEEPLPLALGRPNCVHCARYFPLWSKI